MSAAAAAAPTPLLTIVALLQQLESSLGPVSPESKRLLQSALSLTQGLDPYLSDVSSDAHPLLDEMLKMNRETDWEELMKQGKTKGRLQPAMSSGAYEAVVLQQFARLTKVRLDNAYHVNEPKS
jgi:hypothetical protein